MKSKNPTNWHWKITPEQIPKIKANDRDTINRVYFDNLSTFRAMAGKYCRHTQLFDFFEDCIQQIYVDLPKYRYDDAKALYWGIRTSFIFASLANRHCCASLDARLSDDEDENLTLLDCIGVDGFKESEEREQARNVLSIIAEQVQLTEQQRDMLTAFAFGCRVYRGIFSDEYREAYSA